ncbi:MAG: hypothetical protein KY468_09235 [Armatimonadetes bacterium]|nr:hypothetical protein [Armatimonadota bacterium]
MIDSSDILDMNLSSLDPIRERFLGRGPGSLTTVELLALVLRTGEEQETALQLAERLLREVGSLRELALSEVETLNGIEGMGIDRAVELRAAIELGKRLIALGDGGVRPTIHSPAEAAAFLMPELRHQSQEHFKVLLLDSKNQVLRAPTITVGTV